MLKLLNARRKHLRRSAKRSHPISSIGENYDHAIDTRKTLIKSRRVLPDEAPSSPTKGLYDREAASSPVAPNRKRKREEPEIDIADKVSGIHGGAANL
jgi:hypothetical protein